VTIWGARRTAGGWSAAREIARGTGANGEPLPCYNPVLFQPSPGRLALIYSVGRENSPWTPYLRWSEDAGESWSAPTPLPAGIRGPDRNRPIALASGEWLHPSTGGERRGRWAHVEFSDAQLKMWRRLPAVPDPRNLEAIQPTLLDHGGNRIQMLCRTYARELATSWSSDSGRTWSPLAGLGMFIANSAIDATRLRDGRCVVIYNPSGQPPADRKLWGERVPLSVAVSTDGERWEKSLELETAHIREGFAYPCVLQASDGRIHLTYTWGRKRIRHVVLDPARL
jgi:predicted neuraminidase